MNPGASTMRARSTLLGALFLVACASKAYDPPPHPPYPDHPIPIAQDPVVAELPAHHFYPRTHVDRRGPIPVAAAFHSLPAMVRSNRCVAAGAIPEGHPGAVKRAKPKKRPSSFVPYAGNTTPSKDATAIAGTTVAPPSATSVDDADYANIETQSSEGGDSRDFEESLDVATSARNDNNRAKRESRRSRRKAKRSHDRARAANGPPSGPPMAQAAPTQDEAYYAEPEYLEPIWPPPEEGWGGATYLSNDDTMSLSSAQRMIFAIDEHLPLPPEHIRPHELLNYFSFQTDPVQAGHDFSVRGEIAPSLRSPGLLTIGLAIAGRPMGREGRRNAVLTLVVDRSGSMKAEGRMEYLKRGLLRMVRELEDGDIVHVVTFDHRVCNPLRNFVVGRDDLDALTKTIHGIRPSGSTNLHAGLTRGYQIADATYQPKYSNRVLVISDAIANRGVTDARTISLVSDWYDARRIRLSGIGVGRKFNDELLDRLTEKGRGAYVFLGSEAEVDAVFGSHFSSLVETLANDVHFRLHLPPSLRMERFHGEESSTQKRDVQAVHFFADTSQLMLADLEPWEGELRPQDEIMLEIEYQDPETGELLVEDHVLNLGEIGASSDNVRKGELIMHFIENMKWLAQRGAPVGWKPQPGTWRDTPAREACTRTRAELHEMAAGTRDPEIGRILSLWDGYCARFEGSAQDRPGRKSPSGDRWPSAGR